MNSFRRGWHAHAKKTGFPGEGVTDIDIAPQSDLMDITSHRQARDVAEILLGQMPSDAPDKELLQKGLIADAMFAGVLTGDEVEYREYVETLMGVTPELIDEKHIQNLAKIVDALLEEQGLGLDAKYKDEYMKKIVIGRKWFVVSAERRIKKILSSELDFAAGAVAKYIDVPGEIVVPELVSKDVSWVGYLGSNPDSSLFMEINTHKRHPQTIGRLAVLAAHEFAGHAVQFSIWRQRVLQNDFNPALALTTMHSPECTQLEAVTQTIEHLLLPNRSWHHDYEDVHVEYREAVFHNAHVKINSGMSEADVFNYVRERLPFETDENITGYITDSRDNPTIRAYFACYQPALDIIRPIFKMPFEQQRRVIGQLYREPMSVEQMRSLVSGQSQP